MNNKSLSLISFDSRAIRYKRDQINIGRIGVTNSVQKGWI